MKCPPSPAMLTPPQVARQLGVRPDRIVRWIKSGELVGFNLAKRSSMRPRFRVSPTELALFLERRRANPSPKVVRQKRRKTANVIEFF